MTETAKILITIGLLLVLAGAFLFLLGKLPFAGKLPGDIIIKRENFSFYFPLATCLLLSALLSFILFLFNRR